MPHQPHQHRHLISRFMGALLQLNEMPSFLFFYHSGMLVALRPRASAACTTPKSDLAN